MSGAGKKVKVTDTGEMMLGLPSTEPVALELTESPGSSPGLFSTKFFRQNGLGLK